MNFISWNVNGLRSAVKKNFYEFFNEIDADFFNVQETRVHENDIALEVPGNYYQYWDSAERPGYAGVTTFTKHKAQNVIYGVDGTDTDVEGRCLTLEYPDFYLINTYVPNSGEELQRLDYRLDWDQKFITFVNKLTGTKPVIIGGDMSVAYQPIDIDDPEEDHHKAGYTQQERDDFGRLLASGFVDTFRALHPHQSGAYTWWSYRYDERARDRGWRMDYFLVSDSIQNDVAESNILGNVMGSDHAPIQLITDGLKLN
ncbi:exodeoxyribonuclease III [Fructilactobacillus fructivorans]|uniref:Exodeoxyribonuclease III n=1 Tax=Fructilactobacillus fructivorans TaxID=1614 RepID=A0AAE6P0Y5_9LACO|nr:exodeoxyribonuclease III [Fructilactobacillus fructivorans]KRK57771.1 exodeoxyribonuclease III Xth [Fructilactobacillus fructivorans]KRN12688.1 exodeoxyribonuclease III Xth [Fructilactobacillus fructivorans]KRN40648.1 exodeoxyribonuclease III Xth [Fructilactobacillus fructivorans]KRN43189.1 exodeoxyribonuclease III Xth [Fructilactobacillus fructivorans]QFX92951.1 exodeoxyribonuclease III [Fructilactobacillus fructivorans]